MLESITTITTVLIALAALLIITLLVWVIRLEVKIKTFLRGKNARTLEDSFIEMSTQLEELRQFKHDSEKYFHDVEKRLRRSVQSIETKRFNPFRGTGDGGNQSFATAFITEDGDGVVFSTLNARDRVSVFAKPLQKLQSTHELSDEEKEVIEKANTRTQNHIV